MSELTVPDVVFETHPDAYAHWRLSIEGNVATLAMAVQEDRPIREGYALKLNSYDLGVDIELADALERLRFEHPEVKVVVITSVLERMFCAGANIRMLGASTHGWKVNFCKFTNETRLYLEDASEHSGLKSLAALNGIAAGGGYELALACDEIALVDDGSSVVSLPEVPLLGVLPGTGGLTRVTDKRKVRRDLADVFCSNADGVKGQRAVDWGLVDHTFPRSRWDESIAAEAERLAATSDRPGEGEGIALTPLKPAVEAGSLKYRFVELQLDHDARVATLRLSGPDAAPPADGEALRALGSESWVLRFWRELDDALLRLRTNTPEVGTLVIHTRGDAEAVLLWDAFLAAEAPKHWAAREVLQKVKRVLKRLDVTSRSILTLVEPESCYAGSFAELVLAADRSYMLDDPEAPTSLRLGVLNGGALPMGNGLTRLASRFLATPEAPARLLEVGTFDAGAALEAGLCTFAPDEIDWEDEVRLAIEERASMSPDALTGMEANLRFAGAETMETKIFGRLTAWQNWIFQRPNAVGEKGALTLYGAGERPSFDFKRV
ncbi:MAG: 2,3-epoxybenzoyl-CoA dihydrolase [Deltaproteobacteria bacterium]|nr:2,3-epoxybenzoyl-CoA dihydrolase [Deltaproteobacteria bacterium]